MQNTQGKQGEGFSAAADAAAAAAQILCNLLLNLIPCCSRGKCVCVVCIHVCEYVTCVWWYSQLWYMCLLQCSFCLCVWQGNKMKVCVVDSLHSQSVSIICFQIVRIYVNMIQNADSIQKWYVSL